MTYSIQEAENLKVVNEALADAASDFTRFFDGIFAHDVELTIAGHGPVARTYHGMTDLFENAENALFQRFAEPLAITVRGVWADGDKVFAQIDSNTRAIDGGAYGNGYMYIMNLKDEKVVSGIEWLDLNAYYEIIQRVEV